MLSIEEARGLSEMDPELAKLAREKHAAFTAKPVTSLGDIQIARLFVRMFLSVKKGSKPKPSSLPYTTQDIQIPVRDGTMLPARVFTPRRKPAHGCPCMYLCHGGGFVLGELDGQDWIGALFTSLGGIVVDVLYRHAPEHPFPTPIHDSYDGLKWVSQNLANLNADPSKGFILGGESNGADVALSIAQLYAEDESLCPPLTGMYLACPTAMNKETVPEKYKDHFISMEENSNDPIRTTKNLEFIESLYKPDLSSPLALPILFPDPSKWPRAFLQVCGMDPARDGGLILDQVLKDSGVETKLDLYPGLPHCFWGPFLHADFTKNHEMRTAEGLTWLLKRAQQ